MHFYGSLEGFKGIFEGAIKDGFWLVAENLELWSQETISFFNEMVNSIVIFLTLNIVFQSEESVDHEREAI